eukprot:TRINITY_DN4418_c2_g2_i1.p1 TRINITY_DN4418_c2_g2~~TRINITY_DN4418_c2_g2_i1.p1  ORF type:complete len:613 (+),score=261.65 TRINITY_DN4418_c2_g2_i1:51-1841(+)
MATPASPLGSHKEVIEAVTACWNNEYDNAMELLKTKKDTHPRFAVEWAFLFLIKDLMGATSKSKEDVMVMFQKADRLAYAQRDGQGKSADAVVPPDEEVAEEETEAVMQAAEEDGVEEVRKEKPKLLSRGWKAMGSGISTISSMGANVFKSATGQANKLPDDPNALRWRLECDVIYADCLLIRSIIQLRGNQYVKGAVNIRKTWGYYQTLIKVLDQRGSEIPTEISDNIKFGVGVFYIFLTLVPSGLMKVLSAIGFIRDSELGEQYLLEVFGNRGVRAPVAALVLLTYYLFIPTGLADVSETLKKAKTLLDKCNEAYPTNSYYNGYTNFYHRKRGETDEAITAIEKAIGFAHSPPMLLRYLKADTLFMATKWQEAADAYEALWKEISDQKITFEYSGQLVMTMASAYVMLHEDAKAMEYMKMVPSVTNTRSKQDANSPKFANRCIAEPKTLALGGFYCLYINRDMAHMNHETLVVLEEQLETIRTKHDLGSVPETAAMVLLFKGVMEKGCGKKNEARNSWKELIAMEKELGAESPTLPYGYYELGELEYREGNLKESKTLFDHGVKLKGEKNDTLTNRYNRAINHLNKAMKGADKK